MPRSIANAPTSRIVTETVPIGRILPVHVRCLRPVAEQTRTPPTFLTYKICKNTAGKTDSRRGSGLMFVVYCCMELENIQRFLLFAGPSFRRAPKR
ncbi:hypothetical protein GGP91_001983 [Salinibacter ruber]|nr:hypothetical protein [Salinibacter ruber]MCS3829897.1 hypothetical protein [Salinibacter ruber]